MEADLSMKGLLASGFVPRCPYTEGDDNEGCPGDLGTSE